jgi:hypothetical protein
MPHAGVGIDVHLPARVIGLGAPQPGSDTSALNDGETEPPSRRLIADSLSAQGLMARYAAAATWRSLPESAFGSLGSPQRRFDRTRMHPDPGLLRDRYGQIG